MRFLNYSLDYSNQECFYTINQVSSEYELICYYYLIYSKNFSPFFITIKLSNRNKWSYHTPCKFYDNGGKLLAETMISRIQRWLSYVNFSTCWNGRWNSEYIFGQLTDKGFFKIFLKFPKIIIPFIERNTTLLFQHK